MSTSNGPHEYRTAAKIVRTFARDVEYMFVGEMMQEDQAYFTLTEEEFEQAQRRIHDLVRASVLNIQWGHIADYACICGETTDDTWFDRTVCPEPCGGMHVRTVCCGRIVGGCANKVQPLEPQMRGTGTVIHLCVCCADRLPCCDGPPVVCSGVPDVDFCYDCGRGHCDICDHLMTPGDGHAS